MLAIAFTTYLLAAPAETQAVRTYEVTPENKTTYVHIRVAPNRIASVRFNREFEPKALYCGDNTRFGVKPLEDNLQINIKALTFDYGADTTCTFLTKSGMPLVLALVITEAKKADSFVNVDFKLSNLPTTEAELSRRLEGVPEQIRQAADTARKDCNDKNALVLAQDASEGIVARRLDARTMANNVLLTVKEFVKIGSRGIIRFHVDNQSREPYPLGTVQVTISEPGKKDAITPDTLAVYFSQTVLERNEQTHGAIVFNLHEVSDNARLTLKLFERNGVRHPELSGLRL